MNRPVSLSAEPLAAALAQAAMRPLAFDGLFGWLHQGFAPSFDTGVVLIAPLGRDARCAHRPTRLFADQLAAAGFPVLRYDHRGTGDSLDLTEVEGDAVTVWLADIARAAEALRRQAGVRRVVLGGVRLGASFAAAAADKADGLMLLAPVLSGRSWLRRLRFSLNQAPAAEESGLDTDGLQLSGGAATRLAEIDLTTLAAPASPVFLAAQNRLVEDYGAALARGGEAVTTSGFPGFRELFLDAHSNLPPTELFEAACAWLTETFGGETACPPQGQPASPALLSEGFIERPVAFGAGLRGILCAPQDPGAAAPCVLFCNTGGDPRAGIGGFSTSAARVLAQRGVTSLRFDFAGLGDSDAVGPDQRPHVYETPREADFDAALDFLEQQGLGQVAVVGVCAGAYHALRAGWRDARVAGVFAVSPVKLVWREGDSLVFGRKDDGKATHHYAQAATDPETWRRLLTGGIDLAAVGRTLHGRTLRRLSSLAQRQAQGSPLAEARRFAARGGRVRMVMGLDDASLDEIESHFGLKGARLAALCGADLEILPDLDHGLARSESRRLAMASLLSWMGV